MANRLFCKAFVQQLRNAHSQLKHIQPYKLGNFWYTKRTTACLNYSPLSQRQLHVKVYDEDARLEAQRKANQIEQREILWEKENDNEDKNVNRKRSQFNRSNKNFQKNTSNFFSKENQDSIKETTNKYKDNPIESDADTFGNTKMGHNEVDDEGDLAEEAFNNRPTRHNKKLRTMEYARQIKEHLNANRLKDAIAVLEQRMLKEDNAKPESYIYNLLISGCGKAGYTRKAFSLFTKMRQRGLQVKGGVYTSLFNACANAPSSVDGLGRANYVREIMLEKGQEPDVRTYNAMIKAYGRCGDVKTAYLLADEMLEKKLNVTVETFNFLLQACASDKQYGFRHCLLTWHKMMQCSLQPDYYTFNTVLRCARDCEFGDLETMQQVLNQILDERQSKLQINEGKSIAETNLLESGNNMTETSTNIEIKKSAENMLETDIVKSNVAVQSKAHDIEQQHLEMPNLLAAQPHLGSLVALAEVHQPHERFLLVGGLHGFLDLMKQHKVTPDIQTFTTMLEVIPPTNAAEKQLLTYIRKIGLKADIDFFNVLIKKRSMRFDYEGAKEVLSMTRTAGLQADIVTYGVLALGCQTQDAARELLQLMCTNDIRINIQILGAMLRQGCAQKNFPYIIEVMQISLDENIKPNDIFLRHLHNFYYSCARAIDARHYLTKKPIFKKQHAKFCDKLRLYYEEQGVAGLKLEDAIKKLKERPYAQYSDADVTGIEPLKNEHLAKKQKLRKYIKKIKIQNLRDDEPTSIPAATKSLE